MTTLITAGPAPCHCGAGPAPAPSVRDIRALARTDPGACGLEADAETLALMLPVFARAVATTSGPHALLSETGGYGPAQLAGRPPRSAMGRIALRLISGRGERLAHSAADPARRRPAALHLFDRHGRLAHRTEIAAPEDMVSLAAMVAELCPGRLCTRVPPAPPPPLASLPAIRAARAGWWLDPHYLHQDALMADGGRARLGCLPHLPPGAARRVAPAVLERLFDHLAYRGLSYCRSVIRPGCQQSHAGPTAPVAREGDLLILRAGESLMALAPRAVSQAWVTRWGQGAIQLLTLELYDQGGDCIATFSADPAAGSLARAEWHRLLSGLPDATSTLQGMRRG